MNIHVPNSELSEEFITPLVSDDMRVRLGQGSDFEAATKAQGALLFDEKNPNGRAAIEERDADMTQLKAKEKAKAKLEDERKGHGAPESWAGRETIAPQSLVSQFFNFLALIVAIVDPAMCVYTTASFLAASGRVENITTVTAAIPFSFLYVLALFTVKGIADALEKKRSRKRFKIAVMIVGLCFVAPYALLFAHSFNFAATTPIDADTVGSGVLLGSAVSQNEATALLTLSILGAITLGAGTTCAVIDAINKNKKLHVNVPDEVIRLDAAIAAIDAESAAIEKDIARLNAFIARFNKAREAFIWRLVSEVTGTRNYLHALSEVSRHEIAMKHAAGNGGAEKGARK